MPTYEYKCMACNHTFEQFQSMSAPPVKKCPVCDKNKVKRLLSMGAGLIFKGGGFYITDYRDQSYKDKAKADTAPTVTDSKSADSKSTGGKSSDTKPSTDAKPAEAKPAVKTEPAPPKTASKSASKSGKRKA